MPDTQTQEAEAEETEQSEDAQTDEGLLSSADDTSKSEANDTDSETTEVENVEETDTEETDTEETENYVPTGELSQEQVDSLPEHMITDDGKVDAEQLVKQNLGFRDKQSEGTLEEAIEFYEEYNGEFEDSDDDQDDGEQQEQANIPESPEDYDITVTNEDGEEVEMDDDVEPILRDVAHEAELSEDQLNEFVNNFERQFQENFTRSIDPDEELSKISDDPQQAQKIVNEVNEKVKNYYERGFLTEDEYNEAIIMGGTAEGVSVLRKFMTRAEDMDEIPTGNTSVGGDSTEDLQKQINEVMDHPAYMDPSHPKHQEKVQEAEQLRQKKMEQSQS